MSKLFEGDPDRYPKSRHIDTVNFTPTSHHHNEYNLQKNHAEHILKAVWLLTFNEFCEFFIEREQLRDHPPVCTGRWLTRIDNKQPFMLGNLRCGAKPEPGHVHTQTYKINTKGKWVKWYSGRCS